jgi:hypothetical protein
MFRAAPRRPADLLATDQAAPPDSTLWGLPESLIHPGGFQRTANFHFSIAGGGTGSAAREPYPAFVYSHLRDTEGSQWGAAASSANMDNPADFDLGFHSKITEN